MTSLVFGGKGGGGDGGGAGGAGGDGGVGGANVNVLKTIAQLGLQNAMASSGERTSAETESYTIPHREGTGGLLRPLPHIPLLTLRTNTPSVLEQDSR